MNFFVPKMQISLHQPYNIYHFVGVAVIPVQYRSFDLPYHFSPSASNGLTIGNLFGVTRPSVPTVILSLLSLYDGTAREQNSTGDP
jgi:hypothetical protein